MALVKYPVKCPTKAGSSILYGQSFTDPPIALPSVSLALFMQVNFLSFLQIYPGWTINIISAKIRSNDDGVP